MSLFLLRSGLFGFLGERFRFLLGFLLEATRFGFFRFLFFFVFD
ncbi:MAG: hypothetical protein O7C59_10810 [Rickettsia endosymbiont of Ixodes persulcatus]|nr:hypothetical protein [Rickettsia endosymbiont of Ixodes persulcatus]